VFGWNYFGQLGTDVENKKQLTPKKLVHSNKFIDIASHWWYRISTALSENGSFFVGGENIRTPKETDFNSFHEIFAHYCGITHLTFDRSTIQAIAEPIKTEANSSTAKRPEVKKISPEESKNSLGQDNLLVEQKQNSRKLGNQANGADSSTKRLLSTVLPATPTKMKLPIPPPKPPATSTEIKPVIAEIENDSSTKQFSNDGKYSNEFKEFEQIGQGTFGQVYKAFNLFDRQHYAMKKVQFKGQCSK